ncbi:DUF262 domain-containing protein [Actinoplanes sp. L3-i22]|uniref:DUF262 domain-containing protein n=1 Tax=Actinoplanes sp. L3-i22 TaxID=2836373 RepID=UPI001C7450B3|nr:DUF262 domain-containing protein [Actinoplanes sp. L3-i22]BCY05403.1 hypothetical protein L3i22_004910 [Actinoplanes sp. L3-i22]
MTVASELSSLEDQLGEERKKVDVASHDFSVRELVRMLADGELSITPEYQRKYRWDDEVSSTFIESVFLGLPIPPIFVATNAGFQWEVVDGLQRLSTLLYFIAEGPDGLKAVNRSKALKLTRLQKLTQLNGVGYDDLPVPLQRYFGRQPLQVISLTDKSSKEVRFDLFERLNAGSIALSPQEVRACIYRGEFNRLLEELASGDLQDLLKLQQARQNDGTAAEQVLKFFAYKNARDKFDGRVKKFLNDYMESVQGSESVEVDIELYSRSVSSLLEATGGGPLLRTATAVTPLVQLEACLVGIAELLTDGVDVTIPPSGWQDDAALVTASTGGSNTRTKLEARINRAKVLFSGRA